MVLQVITIIKLCNIKVEMNTKIRPLKKYVRVARTELLILAFNLFSNQNQMIRFV